MRVLLVQMPFFTLDTPSISLALVKASLEEAGIQCDLRYLSLEFGKRIGAGVYSWIAGASPPYLLFGDLVFSPSLHGSTIGRRRIDELMATLGEHGDPGIPSTMIELFPELVEQANAFLLESLRKIDWRLYGLVGFGTMFQIAPALAMAKLVKSLDAAPQIILGGSNCEGEMGEHLHRRFPFIDYVCRGEGERLIVELADHLASGGARPDHIQGLVWREGEKTRCNGHTAAGPIADPSAPDYPLDRLPIPSYDDWIDQIEPLGLVDTDRRRLPIETSRGCWYGAKHHCVFCGLNGETIAYRRKSPERALEEFRLLQDTGVKMIHSVDDILDMRYFQNVLPELAKRNVDCEIFFEIKANLTRKHVRILRQAGVTWIQPGVESLSSRVLKLMDKGVTALQNIRLLKHVAEMGIGAAWNLLFGFPGEDPQDYQEMADLIPMLAHLQPPYLACCPVRVHRFSPMFVNRDSFNITDVEPAQAYYEIYPFDREAVSHLAYYFDHRYRSHPDPMSYIGPCVEAVRNWHSEVGEAAFLSFGSREALHLIDTRRVASHATAVLRGLERDAFELCADGISRTRLAAALQRPAQEVEAVVDMFLERHWAVELDGKLLTLAVPTALPPLLPAALAAKGLQQKYCRQMARFHEGFTLPPTPEQAPARTTVTANVAEQV